LLVKNEDGPSGIGGLSLCACDLRSKWRRVTYYNGKSSISMVISAAAAKNCLLDEIDAAVQLVLENPELREDPEPINRVFEPIMSDPRLALPD
jgi:hypothetical protein